MRIAVIDLGTVSVRLEIYQVDPRAGTLGLCFQNVELIYRERKMLRLGDRVYETGRLTVQGKELALAAFRGIRNALEQYTAERVSAVATCALRQAEDGPLFIDELSRVLGHEIEIITPEAEAVLAGEGILSFEEGLPDPAVLVDIGGGSTEIAICRSKEIINSASFPLGVIRCQQLFLKTIPPVPDSPEAGIEGLRRYTRNTLAVVESFSGINQVEQIIVASGSSRALCRILAGGESPSHLLSRHSLEEFITQISPMTVEEIARIPKMEKNRADIILAGAVICRELLSILGVDKLRPTRYSIRHGLLAREISRVLGKPPISTVGASS